MAKNKRIVCIILNLLVAIFALIGLIESFTTSGFMMFQYYTLDSNLFLLVASTILAIYEIISLKKNTPVPNTVKFVKFMATCTVTLTFLVVLFILVPTLGGFAPMFFDKCVFWHHLVCPIMAIVTLLTCDEKVDEVKNATFRAFIPTLVYGVIVIILNFTKTLHGPYPFLYVYEQPIYMSFIWAIIVFGGAYGICALLWFLYKKVSKN